MKFIKLIFILLLALGACRESEYQKLVKRELSSGVRRDSVLLGINLGNTREEFYGRCFDLNAQQLVTEGPSGATVQYMFVDSLVHRKPESLRLLFIPAFDNRDVISEMNLEFSYNAWSPWNRAYQADSLEAKVVSILEHWYRGNPFIFVEIDGHPLPVKVDGNRRMFVYKKDERNVVVKVQDILHRDHKHESL